jgi:D-arginine dehydrogenase
MGRRRIVIVGGGIAGAACAWAVSARAQDEVVVLEREALLAAHSTSKNAGILRTLTENEATTRLALETASFLAAPPEGFSDVPLIDPVGLVLVPDALGPQRISDWLARKLPGTVEQPSLERIAALLPHFQGTREGALFVRDEGHIDTAALFEGLVREARRRGVRFETDAEVRALITRDGVARGVRLCDGRELAAEVVVLAAGGWAARLGASAGSSLALEARRRHLLVTAPDADGVDPRWPVLWSEPDAFYAKPESGGLLVCACDQDAIDPDQCHERAEVRELIAARIGGLLPDHADAGAAHFWAGMRTFAEDSSFAIGFDADIAGLFWVAGLGGHGMSTSIGVGRYAAALLAGEEVDPELERQLDPGRFSRAALG